MRTVGIVMECNPFHEGHQYIIERGKEIAEGGPVIVVMSGDFVQRGIPAVQAKEIRVQRILDAGADLALELPVRYATASAESFASGAVRILNALGIVTDLVFGSETGDLETLQRQAAFLVEEPEDYRILLKEKLAEGLPFPAARAAAAAGCREHLSLPSAANDLLGEEYLKELLRSGSRITPHAIPRIPARTASSIREELQKKGDGIFADDFSGLLLEKLFLCADPREHLPLAGYAGVTPELANRITHLLPRFVSWTQFCGLLKTRNITYTAVSRGLLHILLDIRKEDGSDSCGYIRLLGARRSALSYIGGIRAAHPALSIVTDHAGYVRALQSGMSPASCRSLLQDIRTSEGYDLVARMTKGIEKAGAPAPAISEFAKPFLVR